MSLPKDPMMLLSVVNTKLRDYYKSLDQLCEDTEESKEQILTTLNSIGYEYNQELNRFV